MNENLHKRLAASCRCGQVAFEASGAPIVGAICYCNDCQEAGRRFEQLPQASAVLDPDGGSNFILYRKDRVRCTKGADQLREYRLTPESSTRRVLAVCCNTPVFVNVIQGHWLTIYRSRFPDGAPPPEVRVMTKHRRPGMDLPDDIPNYAGHSGKFMWRLLTAWIAMGFRIPRIAYGTTPWVGPLPLA